VSESPFRTAAGAVWLPRDFLAVDGPDTVKFLQGQLSQQVEIDVGASAWALLLSPQGKLVAFLRMLRVGPERYVLETDSGFGDAVAERLNRFKLRIKATVEPLAWKCLAVRGPDAHGAVPAGGVVADWPGLPGRDLVGASPAVPGGVPVLDLEAYERARIEAGIPVMGKELDESTIPAEAGIVDQAVTSVSWTKGCYTGQELVARIDSRGGNVPRRLRGVRLSGPAPAGAEVHAGGKKAGRLTSVAGDVALAYVGRAVTPPAEVAVVWDGGSAPARVEPLPLVP